MRRPSAAAIASLVAVGGAVLFVAAQLQPELLLRDTTPSGGDMGAHVWGPAYLRDHLLSRGRLAGWAPDWYAGFPYPTFYFPLPALLIVLADVALPYNIAFKLVTVLGMVTLPVAAWAFGRLAGMRAPAPACLAVATVPFLFDRSYTIYGGNIASTLAGEFSFSISLSLALVFLGLLARGLETGRHRVLAAVLLAATLLCHVVPTLFAVVGALVLTLVRPQARRFLHTTTVGAVGGLLAAFWVVPFLLRLPYTNDMGWEKLETYRNSLLPASARWVVALAVVGALASLLFHLRTGIFLVVMSALAALAFRFFPDGKLWNARLLPFWFLCIYLLAGLAVAELGRGLGGALGRTEGATERLGALVTPVVALGVALFLVATPLHVLPSWAQWGTNDRSFIPDWVRWNYAGYEDKPSYVEYRDLIAAMGRVGRRHGCGRAHWEYEPELDRLGTPMALMLLPYWTRGCIDSMEGLYFESAATTPYHFLTSSELSLRPSRPQRGLPYRELDVARGVRHLQLMGVRYYMALSPEAQAGARLHPDLRLVESVGPFPVTYENQVQQRTWEVYEVRDSALVTPLQHAPVVVPGASGEKAWLRSAVAWFQDESRWAVPLAEDGPRSWGRSGARAAAPRPVRPAAISAVRVRNDRMSFRVDRPGSPVLVKVSYFPNWEATGAQGPWRVTPNSMVVVPTRNQVDLRYATSGAERAGWTLSGLGLLLLLLLARGRRSRKEDDGGRLPGAFEVATPEPAVASGIPQREPEAYQTGR